MLRVAIVCEGSTDYPVLRQVIEAVVSDEPMTFSEIQPDFDALRRKVAGTPGPGWQGVRAFLGRPDLTVAAARHDVLIIHVDADIRRLAELAPRLRDAADGDEELEPLCDHVKSWMPVIPAPALIALPRESTDAWLVAVHTKRKNVEQIDDPAAALQTAGLGMREDLPEKSRARYAELARALAPLLMDEKRLAKSVPELSRFAAKLKARVRAIRAARSKK